MPDSLKFPRMLRAVIELMGCQRLARFRRRIVCELIALAFRRPRCNRLAGRQSRLMPRLAAIIGSLNNLPEPSAGLRRIEPVWIRGRTLKVINFPAREVRTAYIPFLALAV